MSKFISFKLEVQLINVLLGHMSIIGPRPERPLIIDNLKVIKDTDLCEVRVSDALDDVEGIIKTKILQLKN